MFLAYVKKRTPDEIADSKKNIGEKKMTRFRSKIPICMK